MEKTVMLLISCNSNVEHTKRSLNNIPQVKNAHIIEGTYDILIKITAPTIKEIKKKILLKIKKLPNIYSTFTIEERTLK